MNLHLNKNRTVLQSNNILWISRHILKLIVCALWTVMLSAIKAAAGQTQYGLPIKVAPFAQAGSVDEMAVLDMNGDGFDDVLAASTYFSPRQNVSIPIQILLNDGHGGFFDGTSQVITGSVPKAVNPKLVVADFNGDGKPDIFIADGGLDEDPWPGAQSILLLSIPDSHYVDATANLPQQLAYTYKAAAADIDGSGHMAIYLGNILPIGPQLLLNDGTGHFTISTGRLPAAQSDLQQNTYFSSQFVDVNGDGCPDLVLGGNVNTESVVLINDCTGHFALLANALPAKLFSDGITEDIKPVKLGSSGKPDLLLSFTHQTPFYQGRAIQVLINNGDGTFHDESAQRLGFQEDTGNFLKYIHLVDTNGDCSIDIFPEFLGPHGNEVRIYTNDGTGHFTRQTTGLPSVFFAPHPIDVNHNGKIGFISNGGDGFYLTPVISGNSGNQCTAVVSALLPGSRSVQVGISATAFATIVNTGTFTANSCSIAPLTNVPASFQYQTTNPATNQVTGLANAPANIAAGAAQSFVFAVTPTAPFGPTDLQLSFDCANTNPAPITTGLNTLLLSASNGPVPDIVALVATTTNNGIVNVPGTNGTGAFAVATVNVGASGSITASADTGSASLRVNISLCQTDPATGQCISAIGPSVATTINANDTPTFAIFVAGTGNVSFDPAVNRIFVRFKDGGDVTRGSTSVAVRTQ
jgi:hypothetical protein